jgi:hypothetical protein
MRKKPQKPTKKVAVVRWHDAHADFNGSWVHEKDIDPDPLEVLSVGVVLDEVKPGHVSIAQSYTSGICDHVLHIPDAMVKEITIVSTIEVDEE